MSSFASSASLTAADVLLDTKPHHRRPKRPTDYIVLNGSLHDPTIGAVRICYYMVQSGGPLTTVAVQTALRGHGFVSSNNLYLKCNNDISYSGGDGDKWDAGVDVVEATSSEERGYGGVIGLDEGVSGNGVRTPSLLLKYSFRPFTENDSHRSLSWGACYGESDISDGDSPLTLAATTASRYEYESLDHVRDNAGASTVSSKCCHTDCPSWLHAAVEYCVGVPLETEVTLLEESIVSKDDIFNAKLGDFKWRLLEIRLIIYVMLSCATFLAFQPMATLPIVNHYWVFTTTCGVLLGLFVSAVAWVLYRPEFLAGICLAVGGGLICTSIARHYVPDSYSAKVIHTIGSVILVFSVYPISLIFIQAIGERRLRRLQLESDIRSQTAHGRTKTIDMSDENGAQIRTKDIEALQSFDKARENMLANYKGHRHGRGGSEKATRSSSQHQGSSSLIDHSDCHHDIIQPTETTHLLSTS
mmetsp:Transcript_3000/g.5376  ORF Transcript_3000/g.5376 Transcript_3000/m.5376 type:complete len:472 (+) Transcript_3000:731-2146(+)